MVKKNNLGRKNVPLTSRVVISTTINYSGQVPRRPSLEELHSINLRKYQEKIKEQRFIYDFLDYPSYHYDNEGVIITAIQLG